MPYFITTFGENEAGELFLADYISGTIYRIQDNDEVAPPTFDPPGTNSFTGIVTLSCISPNVVIRYTTNGTDPAPTDAAMSSGTTVSVASGMTLKARAFRNDLNPSPISTISYNLKVARPTFSPPLGPVTNRQPISIACLTPGATIRFTTDGSDPTAASATYSGPIIYTNGVVVKARAFKSGFADSAVGMFSPLGVAIESISTFQNGLYNYITYRSIPGWTFQMQVAEDPTQWRNYGAPESGTGDLVTFDGSNVFPPPTRRLFRLKALEDP